MKNALSAERAYDGAARLMGAGAAMVKLEGGGWVNEVIARLSERDVRFAVETFMAADRKRLYEDYKHYTDLEKLQARARSHTQELEDLFAQDAAEQAKSAAERAPT